MSVVWSVVLHWGVYVLAWYSEWNIPRILRCHFPIDSYFSGTGVRNSEDFLSSWCHCKLPNSVSCWTVRRRHAVKCSTFKIDAVWSMCVPVTDSRKGLRPFSAFVAPFNLITGLITLAYLGCVPWSANFSPTVNNVWSRREYQMLSTS